MTVQTRMKICWAKVAPFVKGLFPMISETDLAWVDGDRDRLFEAIGRYYKKPTIIDQERICGKIQEFLKMRGGQGGNNGSETP